jgi:hypothetical protein
MSYYLKLGMHQRVPLPTPVSSSLCRDLAKQLTGIEYDKVAPGTKTKDWYYTEAAASLNEADEALRNVSAGMLDEEPVSLTMGKSELFVLPACQYTNATVILNLARGQPKEAHMAVDRLLQRQPRNIIALTAQVSSLESWVTIEADN